MINWINDLVYNPKSKMKVVHLDRLISYHSDEVSDREEEGAITKILSETTIQNLEEGRSSGNIYIVLII